MVHGNLKSDDNERKTGVHRSVPYKGVTFDLSAYILLKSDGCSLICAHNRTRSSKHVCCEGIVAIGSTNDRTAEIINSRKTGWQDERLIKVFSFLIK